MKYFFILGLLTAGYYTIADNTIPANSELSQLIVENKPPRQMENKIIAEQQLQIKILAPIFTWD